METIARQVDRGPRSASFGGWYGLQAYRIQRRITQLGRHHYLQTAAILERAAGSGRRVPLVIGGHQDSVAGLAAGAAARGAGGLRRELHRRPACPDRGRGRELAGPVIEGWVARRERELAEEILGGPATGRGRTARMPCRGRPGVVDHLLVAHEGMIPGSCGWLRRAGAPAAECPDCGTAARPVPDLLEEENVQRTLDDNGRVTMIRDAPFSVAARLRFPVTADGSRR